MLTALEFRLGILLMAWVVVVFLLISARSRAGNTPKRRWMYAFCVALATAYGPFVVAALNTWLFDGSETWLCGEFWKILGVVPGGIIIEETSLAIWHQRPGKILSPTVELTFALLLSAAIVIVASWLAASARRLRWVLLPLLAGMFAYGAMALDAAFRM
jgi:hypothetical protein